MKPELTLAYSPCPNDTFLFYHLIHGDISEKFSVKEELHDVEKLPVNISITILHAIHARLYETLKYVKDDDWNNRTVFHPEHKKTMRLWFLLGMYAWHGKHHVAHITTLREKRGW